MTASLLLFLNNDLFKLFAVLFSFVIILVFAKNYFDKKKLEKKLSIDHFINEFRGEKFQRFNVQTNIEVHAEYLNPEFELIAKLESVTQNRFPKPAIIRLEKIVRVGQMSIRLSDRVLGSLGNLKTFYAGMLLVNRHNSLSLIEHIEFTETIKSIAHEFDLEFKIDEYADVVKRLKPLRSTINTLDGKLILIIKFNEFPSDFAMNEFAEKFCFTGYAENRFAKVNKSGSLEFTLVPSNYLNELNIIMDLPRVEYPERVFKTMYEVAGWLVTQFDGCIIDKNGNQISTESKSIISNQISNKTQRLKKIGLIPGESLSMKVFN